MKQPKVLVIDDDPLKLHLMETLLGSIGFDAQTTDDPQFGLALMRNQSFDGVLLDLCMPGFDGWWVLRAMRDRGINVPVAVTTCYPLNEEDRDNLVKLGASLIHTEALTLPTLRDLTNQLLKKDANYGRQRMERITSIGIGSLAAFGVTA